MALSTIDYLVKELSARLGTRTELEDVEGTAPKGRILRAINDAFQEVAATYKIKQLESEASVILQSQLYSAQTATAAANDITVTGIGGTVWGGAALVDRALWREWLFKFDDETTWHQIIDVTANDSLTVAPKFTSSFTGKTYKIWRSKWALPSTSSGVPSDVYSILDVTDLQNQRRLEQQDFRAYDRTPLLTGDPNRYFRIKDYLYMQPVPTEEKLLYKIRFLVRPGFRTTGSSLTLSPLPEEWQSVVMDVATGRCLMHQMEDQRAQAYFQMAEKKARALRDPGADEAEDARVKLRPSRPYIERAS